MKTNSLCGKRDPSSLDLPTGAFDTPHTAVDHNGQNQPDTWNAPQPESSSPLWTRPKARRPSHGGPAVEPPPWPQHAPNKLARAARKSVSFVQIADYAADIFAELGLPQDKAPTSEDSERAFHLLTDALDDANGRGPYLSASIADLVQTVRFNNGMRRARSEPPTHRRLSSQPDEIDANRLALGRDNAHLYIASACPSGFDLSLRQYVELLWSEGATAAVALIRAPWWPSHGAIEVEGPVQAFVEHEQPFWLPASRPSPNVRNRDGFLHRNTPLDTEIKVILRTIRLQRGNETRPLMLLECPQWPDFQALHAQTLFAMCQLLERVRTPGPTAVHCMGGRGRTGTFIFAHALYQSMGDVPHARQFEHAVMIFLAMRLQRTGLIETPEQWCSALDSAAPGAPTQP